MLLQPDVHDVSMHSLKFSSANNLINVLSDFCKLHYLSTPTAAGMQDLLEKQVLIPLVSSLPRTTQRERLSRLSMNSCAGGVESKKRLLQRATWECMYV